MTKKETKYAKDKQRGTQRILHRIAKKEAAKKIEEELIARNVRRAAAA
jgi:hypothetical protein